ncbi:MAG TPA: bifunctional adenosylcobinamide kinase/adenosylcobinamide-phosphate guanylyltransferase, partial [Longimicrobiales bacterium]
GAGGTAIEDAAHAAVAAEVDALLDAAATRAGTLLVVTNEVGFGIVPPTALGRWFRDALGTANRRLAAAADEVVLLVSGVPLHIKGGVPFPGGAAPPAT